MPVTLLDRRSATAKLRRFQIEDERIIADEDSVIKQAMRLDAITTIRLSVEVAGRDQQIVCRVTAQDGSEIVFGSRIREGATRWRNNAVEYQTFLRALHTALRPRWDEITFIEGPSAGLRWTIFGGGLVVALGGAAAALTLLWRDQVAGFFLIPVVILGGWLAVMFRPRRPTPYDPAAYTGQ
tara:strand:- start:637 stop:1182 length:546 start_codon:yes stop_codon:yes gene_type:complete